MPRFRDLGYKTQLGLFNGVHYIKLTSNGKPNKDGRPIIALHGWPSTTGWEKHLLDQVRASYVDGFPFNELVATGRVVYIPFTGGNWGHESNVDSQTAIGTGGGLDAVDEMITLAVAEGYSSSQIDLVGGSMGALNAINYAWKNPTKVYRVFLYVPALSISSLYDNGFSANLTDVYGGVDRTSTLANAAQYDPSNAVENGSEIMTIANKVLVAASDPDSIVGYTQAEAFCSAYSIPLITMSSNHFDIDDPAFDEHVVYQHLAGDITSLPTPHINVSPTANNSSTSMVQDTEKSLNFSFVALDADGDSITIDIEEGYPFHGTLTQDGAEWNLWTYVPTPGWFGTDNIKWRAQDEHGVFSNWATIIITVEEDPEATKMYASTAGIDSTGATDVTAALRTWLNSIPAGWSGYLDENGIYKVDWLHLDGMAPGVNVYGRGSYLFKGTESLAGSGSNIGQGYREPVIHLHGVSDITFHDTTAVGHHYANDGNYLDYLADPVTYYRTGGNKVGYPSHATHGYQPGYEWNHGFLCDDTSNIRFVNCKAMDVHGDGFAIGPTFSGGVTPTSFNTILDNCEVEGIGRMGVGVWQADVVRINGGYYRSIGRAVFDLEPIGASEFVNDVIINGARVGSHRNYFVTAAGEMNVDNVEVMNCTFDTGGPSVYDALGDLDTGNAMVVFAKSRGTGTRNNWKVHHNDQETPEYLPAVPQVAEGGDGKKRLMVFENSNSVEVYNNRQLFQPGDQNTIAVSLNNVASKNIHDNVWTSVDFALEENEPSIEEQIIAWDFRTMTSLPTGLYNLADTGGSLFGATHHNQYFSNKVSFDLTNGLVLGASLHPTRTRNGFPSWDTGGVWTRHNDSNSSALLPKFFRCVVRANIKRILGHWPAIWFTARPEGADDVEIDLFEYFGAWQEPRGLQNAFKTTLHFTNDVGDDWHGLPKFNEPTQPPYPKPLFWNDGQGWHDYEVRVHPGGTGEGQFRIEFWLDGTYLWHCTQTEVNTWSATTTNKIPGSLGTFNNAWDSVEGFHILMNYQVGNIQDGDVGVPSTTENTNVEAYIQKLDAWSLVGVPAAEPPPPESLNPISISDHAYSLGGTRMQEYLSDNDYWASKIPIWKDEVGTADLVQNNSAFQATMGNNNWGFGKRALRFDSGSGQYYESPAITSLTEFTIIALIEDTGLRNATEVFVDGLISANSNLLQITPTSRKIQRWSGSGSTISASNPVLNDGMPTLVICETGPTRRRLTVNGIVTDAGSGPFTNNPHAGFTVGTAHNQTLPFDGNVVAICRVPRLLTVSEPPMILEWAKQNWNVT